MSRIPDSNGAIVKVQPNAQLQGQLDPDHHFPGVDLQIFGGQQGGGRVANMQGFVKGYFTQTNDVKRSHNIMLYFTPDQLPVLTNLATEFAVFNGWFSSIPGPTICNRAFAHYGTSFGQVGMDIFHILDPIPSIYERMSGLKVLQNLVELNLSGTRVIDSSLSDLRYLKNLKVLKLRNTRVNDISQLKDLQNLTELDVTYTRVRDISPSRA